MLIFIIFVFILADVLMLFFSSVFKSNSDAFSLDSRDRFVDGDDTVYRMEASGIPAEIAQDIV